MKFDKNILGILLSAIAVILFSLVFFYLNGVIGLDGYFTMYKVVLNPFSDMMAKIFEDVHPPLYYFILWSVLKVLNLIGISYNPMIVGKIVSWVPVGLIVLFALTVIRKRFGWLFAGIFSICIVSLPNLMFYGTEIRMYSLGLLFLTLCFYYAYRVTVESNWKNWGLVTLFTILGVYTQYFIGEILFCIYLVLLGWLLLNNRKEVKKWLVSAIVSVIAFLPWVPILINQIRIGNASWITVPDLAYLKYTILFIFSETHELTIAGSLLILAFVVLVVYYYVYYLKPKANEDSDNQKYSILDKLKKTNFLVLGILVFVLAIVLGFVVSHLLVPSFLSRYMVPALGILYLAFTYLLTKTYSKKVIFVPILIIILISSAISTSIYIDNQIDNKITGKQYNKLIKSIDSDDTIIITTILQRYKIIHRYGPEKLRSHVYLYPTKTQKGMPRSRVLNDTTFLKKINDGLEKGKVIYLFTNKEDSIIVEAFLNNNGYNIEKIKTLHKTGDVHTKYPRLIYKIVKNNETAPS